MFIYIYYWMFYVWLLVTLLIYLNIYFLVYLNPFFVVTNIIQEMDHCWSKLKSLFENPPVERKKIAKYFTIIISKKTHERYFKKVQKWIFFSFIALYKDESLTCQISFLKLLKKKKKVFTLILNCAGWGTKLRKKTSFIFTY